MPVVANDAWQHNFQELLFSAFLRLSQQDSWHSSICCEAGKVTIVSKVSLSFKNPGVHLDLQCLFISLASKMRVICFPLGFLTLRKNITHCLGQSVQHL